MPLVRKLALSFGLLVVHEVLILILVSEIKQRILRKNFRVKSGIAVKYVKVEEKHDQGDQFDQ